MSDRYEPPVVKSTLVTAAQARKVLEIGYPTFDVQIVWNPVGKEPGTALILGEFDIASLAQL